MRRTRCSSNEQGFTFVELLVVMTILGVLAYIAIPAFNGESSQAAFQGALRELTQDLRRAHYEAVSSREDRSIMLPSADRYALHATVPGQTVTSPLKNVRLSERLRFAGVLNAAVVPPTAIVVPASSFPAEVRFTGTADVQVTVGGNTLPVNSSATILLESRDSKYRARIVIYQTTAYTRVYEISCPSACTAW